MYGLTACRADGRDATGEIEARGTEAHFVEDAGAPGTGPLPGRRVNMSVMHADEAGDHGAAGEVDNSAPSGVLTDVSVPISRMLP